jgi:hypothetical protein
MEQYCHTTHSRVGTPNLLQNSSKQPERLSDGTKDKSSIFQRFLHQTTCPSGRSNNSVSGLFTLILQSQAEVENETVNLCY